MKHFYSNNFDYEWGGGFTSMKACKAIDKTVTSFPIDENGFVDMKYLYSEIDEKKILSYIRSGDFTSVSNYLDNVYYLKQSYSAIKRYLLFNIMNTIIRYISDTVHDVEKFNALVVPLFTHETINGRYKVLKDICATLCEHSQPLSGSKLCVRVRNYIERNYLDPNLSVSSIADTLGLHYVYLSSTFKKQSHEGIPTCINRIRITKSKILLSDLDKTVEEVALAVGYSTSKTFIRVFKSFECITPSKYRARIVSNEFEKIMRVHSDEI